MICGAVGFHQGPFCCRINFNSAHFQVVSLLVSKNQGILFRHPTTEWHCVALSPIPHLRVALYDCCIERIRKHFIGFFYASHTERYHSVRCFNRFKPCTQVVHFTHHCLMCHLINQSCRAEQRLLALQSDYLLQILLVWSNLLDSL